DTRGRNPVETVEAPVDELCSKCEQLHLSKGKFLPNLEDNVTSLPGVLASGFDPLGMGQCSLGFLDEIYRRRASCSFCWLVFNATYTETGSIGFDGLTDTGERVLFTRRMRIYDPNEILPNTYIMLVSDDETLSNPTFLARRVANSQIDLAHVQRWLNVCELHHGSFCDGNRMRSKLRDQLRFIDVQLGKLIISDMTDNEGDNLRYATLSYTWGSYPIFRTLKKSVAELHQAGRLSPDSNTLARTVRDGIVLAKNLGFRYISIDSLCIIQDSMED
ncbi:hypothetical protein PG997_000566, partial [Apiospora hydei]